MSIFIPYNAVICWDRIMITLGVWLSLVIDGQVTLHYTKYSLRSYDCSNCWVKICGKTYSASRPSTMGMLAGGSLGRYFNEPSSSDTWEDSRRGEVWQQKHPVQVLNHRFVDLNLCRFHLYLLKRVLLNCNSYTYYSCVWFENYNRRDLRLYYIAHTSN